jgi:hypothetical protein
MATAPRSSRQYAQLVIETPFADEVQALLDKCPPQWRATVELMVASHERRVAEHVRQKEKLRPQLRDMSPKLGTYTAAESARGNPVIAARSIADIRAALKPTKEVR